MSAQEDISEYEHEAWLAELYDEHAEQAREEFKAERMSSYYRSNPAVARAAFRARDEARLIFPYSPSAALVLATSAAEVAIKSVLIRPLVYGLVHSEALAGHVTDIVGAQQQLDRFSNLLFGLLDQIAGINLRSYCRENSTKTLWEELHLNQQVRNAVVHRAELTTGEAAETAIALASSVLDEIIPLVLDKLSMHLHDDHTICGREHFDPNILKGIEALIERGDIEG
jgi:hypothetical protein